MDLVLLALLVAAQIAGVVLIIAFKRRKLRAKRSPFTSEFLRPVGHSLSVELEALEEDISTSVMSYCLMPFVAILAYVAIKQTWGPDVALVPWGLGAGVVAYGSFALWKLWRLTERKSKLKLGLEAELAVGQSLDQLMLKGARVFHDFPAAGFNIDHIVIYETGVFAIETKGRLKPDLGRGKADAAITFDGKSVKFPGWIETKPVDQARRQAEWLSCFLTSAVGSPVQVIAVLTFPGWFIEWADRFDVRVCNLKNPAFLTTRRFGNAIAPELVQRLAHQVEQRCRNLPSSFKGRKVPFGMGR